MNWPTECAVVIPCLNESERIAHVVGAVRSHLPNVFVVDDGSQDDTGGVAENAGAKVLRHTAPRGKGAALQTGWKYAKESGFKWALTMDGDGQHSAEDVPGFLNAAEQTGAPLIIGDRMAQPDGMPWLRRLVNHWMSKRISTLVGTSISDSQCGFRLMQLEAWAALPVYATHFEIESDVLLAFALNERAIEFVPVQVIYSSEQSKIHPVRDTLRWFRWWRQAKQRVADSRRASDKFSPISVPGAAVSRS
jgi:glycosyltransferase involved in cell wall biosynthesis